MRRVMTLVTVEGEPAAVQPAAAEVEEGEGEEIEPDQGFTRPALLILTPFRAQALKWLSALSSSLPGKIEGEDRYKREFGLPEGASDKLKDAPSGTYAEDHVEVHVRSFTRYATRTDDMHLHQILSGNVDDSFRLGVKLTKKSVKLFADFYGCDLIVASPLGLRVSIEKEK